MAGVGVPKAGDCSFLPEGGLANHEATRLQWFDHTLKGLASGAEGLPAVQYFVMGGGEGLASTGKTILHGGRWKSATEWPPAGSQPVSYCLHSQGLLSEVVPEGAPTSTSFTFDPTRPMPTIGGHLSAIPVEAGGFDQRNDPRFPTAEGTLPLSARPDVLCFTTEPLEDDIEVSGPVVVRLWVSSDAPDTDFTAKLIDVYPPGGAYPDGCALNLTDSICRLRFRNGFEDEELAVPGEVYELEFELYPTANLFVKGHRIRVDISSSNYPRFELNPNTGGPLGIERRMRTAENSVYHSAEHPSQIVLSVMTHAE